MIIPADPYGDRDDWLAKRARGVGASDVAGILNLSPWATPFTVWADKTQGTTQPVNESMEWGQKLENLVADEFEDREGLYVGSRQLLIHHPEYPWAMATLDGLVYEGLVTDDADPEFSIGNYEGKTEALFGRWKQIPDHYQCQIQWQLFVTGHDNGWMVVLHGGRQFEVYPYERDQGLINMMVDRVSEFRAKHLLEQLDGTPPPPPEVEGGDAESRTINDLWPDPEPESKVEVDGSLVTTLRSLKAEKSRVEKEIDRYEARLKVSLADAEIGTVNGAPVVTWKKTHRKAYVVKEADFRRLTMVKEKK